MEFSSPTQIYLYKKNFYITSFSFCKPVYVGFFCCLCLCYSPEMIFMTHFFQTIFLWSLIGTPSCLTSLPPELNSPHTLHSVQSPKMKSHERSEFRLCGRGFDDTFHHKIFWLACFHLKSQNWRNECPLFFIQLCLGVHMVRLSFIILSGQLKA